MPQANLDHLEAALDVALGVDEGLAVLGGEQAGEVVIFGLDQLQKLEHHPRPALRVGGRPGRLGRGRVGDDLLDLGFARERDLGLHLAGVRVEHVAGAPRRAAFDLFAADEMADIAHHSFLPPSRGAFIGPGAVHGRAINLSLTRGIAQAPARGKPARNLPKTPAEQPAEQPDCRTMRPKW